MAADEKWYFTKDQLANTPSRKCGYDADKELSNRQQAANFIQDMGQRLQVTQLCINTAIVYMHRFYVYHSFSHFHRNAIATAALFLAAKVEEQPRKLEHVIKVGHVCLHRETPPLDTKSEGEKTSDTKPKKPSCHEYLLSLPRPDNYLEQAQELVVNENVLLQTLGFDVAIDHPHTHVVRCCHMVKASKDLAQTSYFMASNSLHLTTMCLQYKPTVVACFCIHLACKWSNWEIPVSNEGKEWFYYVDKSVTFEQLEQLTAEFLQIFDKCPTKLKRKIMAITATQSPMIPSHGAVQPSQLFDNEPRKVVQEQRHPLLPSPSALDEVHRRPSSSTTTPHSSSKVVNLDAYRRKEKERIEREAKHGPPSAQPRESHHHTPGSHPNKPPPGVKYPSTPSVPGARPPPLHQRDGLKTPQNPPREFSRPIVPASKDLARREQPQVRELTKREPQQPSIFSPPKHDSVVNSLSDSQMDLTSNHLNSLTSVNKNSSQEWQDTLNHNNELDTNRHHSDKYNLVNKDNRQIDPKRLHNKDQRSSVPKEGQKLSIEDSQRMFNKYSHRKEEGKEHERIDLAKRPPDSDLSLKRPPFSSTVTPPPPQPQPPSSSVSHQLSKRNEFHQKRDEVVRPSNSGKHMVPSSQHVSVSKSQHRVPSPVVSSSNGRPPQSTSQSQHSSAPQSSGSNRVSTPGSSQHRPPSSQHRSSSPFVQHTQRPKSPKAASNPKLMENVESKPQKSVHGTPTKVDPRNGHPIERREINHRQDLVKQEAGVHRSDTGRQDFIKQEPAGRLDSSVVKQESGAHRHDVVKQDVPFRIDSIKQEGSRLDIVKQEQVERRPEPLKLEVVQKCQVEGGRSASSILRAVETPKPDVQKLADTPSKTESDTFIASSSQSTPKSSTSSSRSSSKSSVPGPNTSSNNNRDSYTQRSSKPSTRHPAPPPSTPKKANVQPEPMSVPPVTSPEFGSPPPPVQNTPTKNIVSNTSYSSRSHRNRTSSSSSEPELVPYVKKLEEMAGYENILDSKKGIKLDNLTLPGRVPDMIQPIRDRIKDDGHNGQGPRSNSSVLSKEVRQPDITKPFPTPIAEVQLHTDSVDIGAIAFPAADTDPTDVFIKSDSSQPSLIDVVNVNEPESIKTIMEPSKVMPLGIALDSTPSKSEHSHKSEKKKKKEKHKHKDKDKNKDREERKHKRKHKDRDKEKHREKEKEQPQSSAPLTAPIKITIPKERLAQASIEMNAPQSLKLKITKPAASSPQSIPSGDLKLKISRNSYEGFSTPFPPKESRKRDRSASKAVEELKPAKAARLESKKSSPGYTKHNGVRGQHHKVSSSQAAGSSEAGRGSKGGSQPL